MSRTSTGSARVVTVAAGLEHTDRTAPVRDDRHRALEVLIGATPTARRSTTASATSARPGWRSTATCSAGSASGRGAP
jgi:hypothetical protein